MEREAARRKNGAGSYWARSDGRWVAAVSSPTGRRTYRYYKTASDAERGLATMVTGLYGRPSVGAKGITFGQLGARWLQDVVRISVEPSTYYHYELSIRRAAPFLHSVPLDQLTTETLQRMYVGLLAQGSSRGTVRHTHYAIHNCLQTGVAWGWLLFNPAKLTRPPRPVKYRVEPLSEPELLRLFRASEGTRWHALWIVLATTGMRLGEALGLTWTALSLEDPDGGYAQIRQSMKRAKPRDSQFWVLGPTKTPAGNRRIKLAPSVVSLLIEHADQQEKERADAGDHWREFGLVFPAGRGTPMSATNLGYPFRRALTLAGLPRRRIHDLRHSCATNLFIRNVSPQVVQSLLGHTLVSTTLEIYGAWIPSLADGVADVQESWISQLSVRGRSHVGILPPPRTSFGSAGFFLTGH